jgi:hypothetical protein
MQSNTKAGQEVDVPMMIRCDEGVSFDGPKIARAVSVWKSLVSDLHPAFLAVEEDLSQNIELILSTNDPSKKMFIRDFIVRSSFFSFEAKCQVVHEWIKSQKILDAKALSLFEDNFRKVVRRRNAVIHGIPCVNNLYQLRLHYFLAGPQHFSVSGKWVGETAEACSHVSKVLRNNLGPIEQVEFK